MSNLVAIGGRLGKDPELKAIGENKKLSFSLAVPNPGKKKDDPNATQWIDVEAWGAKAEAIEKFFKKGDGIYVKGQLKTDKWEKEGEARSRMLVSLESFDFPLSNKNHGGDSTPKEKTMTEAPKLNKEEVPDF